MSLIEEISNKLNSTKSVGTSFDFSIGTKQFSQDKATRTYLSFFNNEQDNENKNERKWTIEISVSLINTAWKNGELDSSLFLKNCTDALLKNFHIYNLSGNIPNNYCVEDDKPISIPDNISQIFNKYKDLFNSEFRNSNTIIFNDEPKSGKTTFIKYYCNKLRAENVQSPPEIWKLDFSNGHDAIILDFMMSLYASQNWDTLKAWIKLHNHVKKTFYIDGQEIYICHGREQDDNTIHDFKAEFSKPPKNCINNQIKLQDEVLCQCSDEPYTELPESDVENILSYEDSEGLFGFYLSPIQKEQENKNTTDKIDIDKFYRTYILALLFEFEVMAPEEQRDIVRVEKLWNKIKINCSKSDEFNCRYFYPARVPWVTARMALAMSACLQKFGNHDIADEIASFSQDVGEYLVKSSIKFVKDGKTYRFWSSGTGLWNSTLETTIICAFALKEFAYSKFPNIVEEGINFINLFKGKGIYFVINEQEGFPIENISSLRLAAIVNV